MNYQDILLFRMRKWDYSNVQMRPFLEKSWIIFRKKKCNEVTLLDREQFNLGEWENQNFFPRRSYYVQNKGHHFLQWLPNFQMYCDFPNFYKISFFFKNWGNSLTWDISHDRNHPQRNFKQLNRKCGPNKLE